MSELPPGLRHQINHRAVACRMPRACWCWTRPTRRLRWSPTCCGSSLGMFGAHNFSLSRIGVAVTQLIRTITVVGMVISFFWVIVDAFADSRLDTAAEQSAGRPAWRL